MLKLFKMLSELLDKTGLTFGEFALLVKRLHSVGPCPAVCDKVALRTWLGALVIAYQQVVADTDTGRDVPLMALAESLVGERWELAYQLFDVFEGGAMPDSACAMPLAVAIAGDSGVDATRVSMLMYTLTTIAKLLRTTLTA
jgi:hypothetical protein